MAELWRINTEETCEPCAAVRPWLASTAYELKFLLPAHLAAELLLRARQAMLPDPHADPTLGEDSYHISSLYFDTPDLATFHRLGWYGQRKLRIRRYGAAAQLFLERKARKGDRVWKWRVPIGEPELALLGSSVPVGAAWPGEWFRRRLAERRLEPRMLVGYLRCARVAMTTVGPVRLTVDRQVFCQPAEGLAVPRFAGGCALLHDHQVVEFKFARVLPGFFKHLMYEFGLKPAAVSKYRLSVSAWGLHAGGNGCTGISGGDLLPDGAGAGCTGERDQSRS